MRWGIGERMGGIPRKFVDRIQGQAAYLDFWWLERPLVEQGSAHIESCNTMLRRGRVIGHRVGDSERVERSTSGCSTSR